MREGPDHDLVVLGGGPAGASAACLTACHGRSVLLIERETGPRHKICGEFLSVEAQAYLAELAIDVRALGGVPIRKVRLVLGRQMAEAVLPFEGVGLTRRTLDEALLRRAQGRGVTIRRGEVVREVAQEGAQGGARIRVDLRGGEAIRARTVFLATGKHDLRNLRRRSGASGGDLIGFKTYLALAPTQDAALGDAIEVILFDGGYAGLQKVEGGVVNLCLLVRRALFERVGKTWDALLDHLCAVSPHLGDRLGAATALLDKPLSISHVPYGFVHRAGGAEPQGLYRLGDQMGVIPSFSGDGISIALHTARVAAATYLDQGNAASLFHRRVAADIAGQIRLAAALYDVSQVRLGRLALVWTSRLCPSALRLVAAWTRVPAVALRQTGALASGSSRP